MSAVVSTCPHCHGRLITAKRPLTRRQTEVYRFVVAFMQQHGYAPTCSEIARGCTLKALSSVSEHLSSLQAKGWIVRRYNEERSIALVEGASA